MSDVVIKAEGLGKKYLIGHQSERERYTALRDVLTRNVKSVLHKTRQLLSGQQLLAGDEVEEFWALRDIDFAIKRGDRVGIIGRNGAGKSTLLKILSRITEPSTGRVEIHGRVASLLEVGTGFHPELTGRENIYLNGAILGMTRAEIKKKFDEIVDFAGVEKFLDTPVKRYSSGMYVRLAFAVAAHLEPEILVVDEVLAVGDAEFQKKCLGKMEDVSKNDGRTVLFVSHNMEVIRQLCNISLFLNEGRLTDHGNTHAIISKYLKSNNSTSNSILNRKLNEYVEIKKFEFNPPIVMSFSNVQYSLEIEFSDNVIINGIAILIYNEFQQRMGIIDLRELMQKGRRTIKIENDIIDISLIEGRYSIGIYLHSNLIVGDFYDLIQIEINSPQREIIPYPKEVRGFIEFKNQSS